MTEKGSDELLAELGDPEQVMAQAEATEAALAAEEELVSSTAPLDDGDEDYPDPDEAPPADEPHDEFDPLPPEEPGP